VKGLPSDAARTRGISISCTEQAIYPPSSGDMWALVRNHAMSPPSDPFFPAAIDCQLFQNAELIRNIHVELEPDAQHYFEK